MEDIYLTVKAPLLSEEEKIRKNIQSTIEELEQRTRKEDSFVLPSSIEGVRISSEPDVNLMRIFILFVPVTLLLLVRQKSKEKEKIQQRQSQLMEDYPVVVNKLVLYLSAGLNLKMAFQFMLNDYMAQEEKEPRYLQEELFIMMNELKSGISERAAYESFGNRTRESCYIRLMALLIQNYQKGNEGLLKVLSQEEEDAFKNRIDRAKKAGEEAGTKLLFPMLLLLIVVMVIVMAPAVFQFQSY